jgi:sensor histidine kinase YesM
MLNNKKIMGRIQPKDFKKRILFHFLFWLFYVLFFGSIYGKYGNDYTWYLFESLCMLPFVMLATYTTIYVLLPFYLKKRNLVLTVFLLAVLIISVTLGERIFLRKINQLPITFDTLFGVTFLYLMLETNFMVAIAFAIKFVKKWKLQQEEKFEIEKQNLQAEMNMLKTQLHPHFLFNTMNNLYALSLEESAKTSEGIAKISDLLRSVLYECNEVEIELNKEIHLIENYIDLEKMRYGNRLNLTFEVKTNTHNFKIAPMLLFTFVENCFKHGSSNDPGNPYINIKVAATENELVFLAENSKISDNITVIEAKNAGIGLKNAKKRLDIIYGEKYKLNIIDGNNKFEVYLSIHK